MTEAAPAPLHALLFNQYYFDLLKRCKDVAKTDRETSRDARNVLRAIKKHYRSYDTAAAEHYNAWCAANGALAAEYLALDDATFRGFVDSEAAQAATWYKDIPFGVVAKMQPNAFNLHQYWTLFGLLAGESTREAGQAIVAALRVVADAAKFEAAVAELPEGMRGPLARLRGVFEEGERAAGGAGIDLSAIEDTTLGRLAKEILEDPSIKEIQESMKDATGIADMFGGDGGGGIAKLMSTVSTKMMSKLASGEIKQENLLEDAMKFAGKLQGMMPGNLMGDLLGGMGGGAGAGGLDLSSLMSMFGNMNRKQKKTAARHADRHADDAASGSRPSSSRHRHRSGAAKAEQLRKKLDAHRKKTETQIE